jgi:hypothetical protein
MRRLRAMNARWLTVMHAGCEGDIEDPALALNRAVGFEPVGRNYLWRRAL